MKISRSVWGILGDGCAVQVDRLSGLRRVFPPVAQLSFWKKQKNIGQSKNPRTVIKRKIPAETRDRRTGEGGKRWASFTVFSTTTVWTRSGPGPAGCRVSNPDPNNTIGLLGKYLSDESFYDFGVRASFKLVIWALWHWQVVYRQGTGGSWYWSGEKLFFLITLYLNNQRTKWEHFFYV